MDWPDDQLIGATTEPLDPWDDYTPERRHRERELFVVRGVPENWMPWTSALRWNFPPTQLLPDSPLSLRVGGEAPPRTLAELEHATSLGIGLGLVLPDGFDLTSLAPAFANVEYLSIGSDGSVGGWDALAVAKRLVQLVVGSPVTGATPTAVLPKLTRAIIPRQLLDIACAAPQLDELQLDLGSQPWPTALVIEGPLNYLEIREASKLTETPVLRHPEALKTLRISNARELDLGTLAPEVSLDWLDVTRTRVLHGAATIARMRDLRILNLERVASIPDAEALSSVTAREVSVRHSDVAAAAALGH